MNFQSRDEIQKHLFESIEFRLEITSASESKYPPIIVDVRSGAGISTRYCSRRSLAIENPDLCGDFKTLKISTFLSTDGVTLDLALSQKENGGREFAHIPDHEQHIGTYQITDGASVELTELTPFGLAPMIAYAKRVYAEDVSIQELPVINHTTGLEITSIRKKANVHLVIIKNVSEQTISSYSYGIEHPLGGTTYKGFGEFISDAEEVALLHLQPYSILVPPRGVEILPEQQTFVIGAVMYADNTCEGIESWLFDLLFLSSKDQYLRQFLHRQIGKLFQASDSQLEAEIAQVQSEISAKLTEKEYLLPGLTVRDKDWAAEEIAERMVWGWLRTMIEKNLRIPDSMAVRYASHLDDKKRASLNQGIERSKKLLGLLHQSS